MTEYVYVFIDILLYNVLYTWFLRALSLLAKNDIQHINKSCTSPAVHRMSMFKRRPLPKVTLNGYQKKHAKMSSKLKCIGSLTNLLSGWAQYPQRLQVPVFFVYLCMNSSCFPQPWPQLQPLTSQVKRRTFSCEDQIQGLSYEKTPTGEPAGASGKSQNLMIHKYL